MFVRMSSRCPPRLPILNSNVWSMRIALAYSISAVVHAGLLGALACCAPSLDRWQVEYTVVRGEPLLVQFASPSAKQDVATSQAAAAPLQATAPAGANVDELPRKLPRNPANRCPHGCRFSTPRWTKLRCKAR